MRPVTAICALLIVASLSACQGAGTTSSAPAYTPPVKAVLDTTKPIQERLEYVSGNVPFYRDVFAGALYDPVILSGALYLPAGDGAFPVVVWQHGSGKASSGSLRDWRNDLRDALRAQGMGFFIADSYTARALGSTSRNQGRLSGTSRVMDAFGALEALADHPRVDGRRIGISGNSWGGIVTLNTTHEGYAGPIVSDSTRFAAHVAFYPSCATKIEEYKPTGAPVLMMLGEADDYTRHEPCLEKAERFRKAGGNVTVKVYPGAHHGFIANEAVRWKPKNWHFNDCGLRVHTTRGEVLAPEIGVSSEGISFSSLIKKYVESGCAKRGVHVGRNPAAAKDALTRTVQFFAEHMGS